MGLFSAYGLMTRLIRGGPLIHWLLVVGEIKISENEVVNPMIQQIPLVPPEPSLKSILFQIILLTLAILGFYILMKYGTPWFLCSLIYGGQCG